MNFLKLSDSNDFSNDFHVHSMDVLDEFSSRKLRYVTSLLRHRQPDVPVLIVDLKVIQEVHKRWKKLMPRVQPFYAVKANTDPHLISTLVKAGASFECASIQEIDTVLQAGGHPSNIIFAHPAKIPSFITDAASKGVDLVVFDSECEVEKLKRLHPNCKAILRLCNDGAFALWKLSQKFGALKDEVPKLLKKALDAKIEVVGVCFHVGAYCQDTKAFRLALEEVQEVFKMAAITMEMSFTLVDIGGGFPGIDDEKPTIEDFSRDINKEVERLFPHSNIKIIAEPGQYYAMRTTAILLQINTKRIRKQGPEENQSNNTDIIHYYMNDGFYGNLNSLTTQPFTLRKCSFVTKSKLNANVKYLSVIWGPTVDSKDVLGKDVMWPELEVGDYVFLDDVGAYNQSTATNFCGFGGTTETYYISAE